jgi:hypothetical protein
MAAALDDIAAALCGHGCGVGLLRLRRYVCNLRKAQPMNPIVLAMLWYWWKGWR